MLCVYSDTLQNYEFILGSSSPQRLNLIKTLLPQISHNLNIQPSNFDENLSKLNITALQYVTMTCQHKLIDVYNICKQKKMLHNDNTIIITCDTIVVDNNNNIIEKAYSDDEAYNMIKSLINQSHKVITVINILKQCNSNDVNNNNNDNNTQFIGYDKLYVQQPPNTIILQSYEQTTVYMCNMTDQQINSYIRTQEYAGKAGGYGIQALASQFISKIEGDYYNVVGLPVHNLTQQIIKLLDLK